MADRMKFFKRHCKYTEAKIDYIDYKEVHLLKHSLSERYKIMPRRLTGNSKEAQDMVAMAIKRARHMALVPYVVTRKKVTTDPSTRSF